MGIRYNWLLKSESEDITEFRKRIDASDFVHVGFAYFGGHSYDQDNKRFMLVIVWNGEFNSIIRDSLPECGFVMECDRDTALRLYEGSLPVMVYAKLLTDENGLFCSEFKLFFEEKAYKISYLGINCTSPDYVPGGFAWDMNKERRSFNNSGSFNGGSYNRGSYNMSSFNLGSFSLGSFSLGSFSLGSFNLGSFNLSSYSFGSFSYTLGSYGFDFFSLGSSSLGAYNFGSYSFGSYSLGSYNFGSHNFGSYNFGSYNPGSCCMGAFAHLNYQNGSQLTMADYKQLYDNIFGVGYLGYGLNLI